MSNSTHRVEVVPIVLEPHKNADSLSVVNVFGGYSCVVRTEDWRGVALGAYIPPDSVVDTRRPEFAFLAEHAKSDGTHRIKAEKRRGIVSFGMLVKLPPPEVAAADIGDDCAHWFGVTHYEPPAPNQQGRGSLITGGEAAKGPNLMAPKYDLEAFRRYHSLFEPGEPVFITEKLHGCSAKYVYSGGKMHCGSRAEWKKEYPCYDHVTMDWLRGQESMRKRDEMGVLTDVVDEEKCQKLFDKLHNGQKPRNLWWNALDATPGLVEWCQANPDIIVYGEVFGNVQSLRYGATNNRPLMFAAFDLLQGGRWLNAMEAFEAAMWNQENVEGLRWAPILQSNVPYSFELVAENADGPSTWPDANHYREGCVVKPMTERYDARLGRVCLKCVGATYLEKEK